MSYIHTNTHFNVTYCIRINKKDMASDTACGHVKPLRVINRIIYC